MGEPESVRLARAEQSIESIQEKLDMLMSEHHERGKVLTQLTTRDALVQSMGTTRAQFEQRIEHGLAMIEDELVRIKGEVSGFRGSMRMLIFVAPVLFALLGWLGNAVVQHIQDDRITSPADVRAVLPGK